MVSLALVVAGLALFQVSGSFITNSPHDAIMTVNGEKITQAQFDRLYNQMIKQKGDLKPDEKQKLMNDLLMEFIRQEVFYQEAKKYGFIVPDQELQFNIASVPAFQKDGHFDQYTYLEMIYRVLGSTPAEFEKDRKKAIAGQKLSQLIASAVLKKKQKALRDNPDILRQEIRNKEMNLVMSDWLAQLNSSLKVNIVSENFKKRLSGAPQPGQ
jgi:peptidyl-prolyl cis-trans isomerase D